MAHHGIAVINYLNFKDEFEGVRFRQLGDKSGCLYWTHCNKIVHYSEMCTE